MLKKPQNQLIYFQCLLLLKGSNSSGEVEDRYPRGPDIFPHARAAGNVGRLHKVGHVCWERSLQSLSQERLEMFSTVAPLCVGEHTSPVICSWWEHYWLRTVQIPERTTKTALLSSFTLNLPDYYGVNLHVNFIKVKVKHFALAKWCSALLSSALGEPICAEVGGV